MEIAYENCGWSTLGPLDAGSSCCGPAGRMAIQKPFLKITF